MRTSSEMLDEVLITGTYGSAKKLGSMVGSNLPPSNRKKFQILRVLIFADALQGQVAGFAGFYFFG